LKGELDKTNGSGMPSLTTTPYEELIIGLVTEGRTPEEIMAFRSRGSNRSSIEAEFPLPGSG